MPVFTISVVGPADGSRHPTPRPTSTVLPDSDDGSAMTIEWEWDDNTNFDNATGRKQTLTTLNNPDGSNASGQPPTNLVEDLRYYWRARAGDGSTWSSWTTAQSVFYDQQVGAAYARNEVNVGVVVNDDRLGYGRNEVNVGVDISDDRAGYARNEENVGVNLADDRYAYARNEYGDVDTSVPTPHIWYIRPDFGREGWEFKVIGQGFGDAGPPTPTYADAEVLLNALQCGVVSWNGVAATANAYNASRKIDPPNDIVNVEHDEIRVTVPTGAESGLVKVRHNAP